MKVDRALHRAIMAEATNPQEGEYPAYYSWFSVQLSVVSRDNSLRYDGRQETPCILLPWGVYYNIERRRPPTAILLKHPRRRFRLLSPTYHRLWTSSSRLLPRRWPRDLPFPIHLAIKSTSTPPFGHFTTAHDAYVLSSLIHTPQWHTRTLSD